MVMCGVQRCGNTRSCVIYWSWAGEGRAVVSDHGAENTVGLISYLVSHKPGILTQVCSPLMPHLGSEHRMSSLGGHPLLVSRSVEWFDSAVSDLKLTCSVAAHLLLTCCPRSGTEKTNPCHMTGSVVKPWIFRCSQYTLESCQTHCFQ